MGAPVTIVSAGNQANPAGAPIGTDTNPFITSPASTAVQVTSDGAAAKTDRSITASTTNQQAAAANTSRRKLIFQNLDASINVHVNVGAVATTGLGSVRLAPGAYLEMTGTSGAVNVIAASGTPLVTIWEI